MSDEQYQIMMVGKDTVSILHIENSKPLALYEIPYYRKDNTKSTQPPQPIDRIKE